VAGDGASGSVPSADAATVSTVAPAGDGQPSRRLRPGLVALFPRPGHGPSESWPLATPALVGRDRDASVRLKDNRLSRSHAMVEPRGRGVFVRDLDSRHGSFVDGERVGAEGRLARMGSVLRFGNTLLLAVDDVERYRAPPRRIEGASLGLPKAVVAGPMLAEVWDQATRIALQSEPALILGETGSGKECVARIIHTHGARRGPFVGINVAAIPATLFEAEVFGHTKGAFTGALAARPGAFVEASSGVLFLDEIGDLKPELQVKLLRAIDTGQVRPLGASRDVPVSARLVSATSRDLEQAREADQFRSDLWYRLSGLVIRVPPLRDRRDDIVLLALEMLREHPTPLQLSVDAAELLLLAAWEGNARQLRQALVRAADQARLADACEIRAEHLPDLTPVKDLKGGLTAQQIREAMLKTGGVALRAAQFLGVSRTTLYNAMARLGIERGSLRRG
jgi:DNA-binding NtrC family response regulator